MKARLRGSGKVGRLNIDVQDVVKLLVGHSRI